MMLRGFALLFVTLPLAAQPIGLQFQAGIPVSDLNHSEFVVRGSATAWANRYVIGPSVEFHITGPLSMEADALYERIHLEGYVQQVPIPNTDILRAAGSAWQFPVLAKFRLRKGPAAPFASAGPSVRVMRFSGELQRTTLLPTSVTGTMGLDESHVRLGLAAGVGVDICVGVVQVSPEFRYTYFGGQIDCSHCGAVEPLRGFDSAMVPTDAPWVILGPNSPA